MKKAILVLSSLAVCGAANAVEDVNAPSFRLGGVSVYPGLAAVVKSDSNIYRAKSATSSVISVLSPSVAFKADKNANAYSLTYAADVGSYTRDVADNFIDQNVLGQADLELSSRSALTIKPEYIIGHDARGSTFGAGTATPNTYKSTGITGSWTYGADEAMARTVLDLGYNTRTYDNNPTVTAAYSKATTTVGGTVYFRVSPNTSLLAHAKNTGINYADDVAATAAQGSGDGAENRFMVGAKWEATAQTTGEFKVGQVQKKFNKTYSNYSGASWEGGLTWSPVSFLNVDFDASKKPTESTFATAKTIVVGNTGIKVAYDLNDRVTLSASGSQVKEEFVGATVPRNDTTNNFGLKAEYKVRNWLIGGLEYTNAAKTSSDATADFKRNIMAVSLRSSL